MKLARPLGLSAFLVMSVFHPCLKVGQPGFFSLQLPQAAARGDSLGPGSGGGADYQQDAKPSDEQVVVAIAEARRIVPFVLNHLESVITNARATGSAKLFNPNGSGDATIPLSTFQKLFPWPERKEDVQARWQRLHFTIEPVKPCYDDDGNEKAASAVPIDSDEVCVSIPKIRQIAVVANLVQRITAILVHEVSHKMGVTDHLILEAAVRTQLPANPRQTLEGPLKNLADTIGSSEGGMTLLAGQTLALLEGAADWSALCYNLATITSSAKDFDQPDVLNGVALATLRPALEAEKQAIRVRTEVFRSYCVRDGQTELLAKLFRGQTAKPINQGGSGVLSIARGTLRRPEFHNAEILRAELQDLKASLSRISQSQ